MRDLLNGLVHYPTDLPQPLLVNHILNQVGDPRQGLALFGNNGVVVPSDAPIQVKNQALKAKALLGESVQVCSGSSDDVYIQAAIDSMPSITTFSSEQRGRIYLMTGTYDIQTSIDLPVGVGLDMDKGAVLIPSANVDVITMDQGASVTGGIIYCYGEDTFSSKAGIKVVAGDTDSIFRNNGLIKDVMLFGPQDTAQDESKGYGIHMYAYSGGIGLMQVVNCKINGFSYGFYGYAESDAVAAWINSNTFTSLQFCYNTIPIYLYNNSANNISANYFKGCQVQCNAVTKYAIYMNGSVNNNDIELKVMDWHTTSNQKPDNVIKISTGSNNRIVTDHPPEYHYDISSITNLVQNMQVNEAGRTELTSNNILHGAKYSYIGHQISQEPMLFDLVDKPYYGGGGNGIYLRKKVAISAFSDYSGTVTGAVKVTTSATHGFSSNTLIEIVGTTNYNDEYNLKNIDATNFYIIHSWDGDDATGNVLGQASPTYTNFNSWPAVTLNGTNQIGKFADEFSFPTGDASLIMVLKPGFAYNDGNTHVLFHWYHAGSNGVVKITKSSANVLELRTDYGAEADTVCTGSVPFTATDILVLIAVRDQTNTETRWYCNGKLIQKQSSVNTTNSASGLGYIGCDKDLGNFAPITLGLIEQISRAMTETEVIEYTDSMLKRMGTNGRQGTDVGTPNTGVTVVEDFNGSYHKTTLTVDVTNALDLGDNVALSDGYLLYTFPTGAYIIDAAYMSIAIQAAGSELPSDTPDVGLATAVGAGANALLSAVGAGAENVITGQTATDCNGTATTITVADQPLARDTADPHTLYFNVADTWADDTGGDLTADIEGTVIIWWRFVT